VKDRADAGGLSGGRVIAGCWSYISLDAFEGEENLFPCRE